MSHCYCLGPVALVRMTPHSTVWLAGLLAGLLGGWLAGCHAAMLVCSLAWAGLGGAWLDRLGGVWLSGPGWAGLLWAVL